MKNVLLVNPPQTNNTYCTPPIGLLYLTSVLEKSGYTVKILDCPSDKMWNTIQSVIIEMDLFRPDVIGITCMTSTYISAVDTAKEIKKYFKGMLILGGAHVKAVGAETILKETDVFDVVVEGEAEDFIVSIIEGKTGNAVKCKEPQDLDAIPFPAWHQVNLSDYSNAISSEKFATMISSRGCPMRCLFCCSSKNVRMRSPENVVSEMDDLSVQYGVKEIIFYDDNFCVNRQRVVDICNLIITKKLKLKIKCETRVNLVDRNLLVLMKKAGVYLIAYGIECGTQKGLNFLRKGITLDMTRTAVKLTHASGIQVLGYFILGLPIETREDIMATINFAIELDVAFAQFALLTALPGTDLWEYAKENNLLEEVQTTSYFGSSAVPSLKSRYLSKEELKKLSKLANRMFYLRVGYIIKTLKRIKSWNDMKSTMRGVKIVLGG